MSTIPHFVQRPGPKPTAVLVVHQLWGDLLLESRTLRLGEGLTAGAARDLHLRVLDTTVARLPGVVPPVAVPGFFEVVDHSQGDLDAPGDVVPVIEADGDRWWLYLEPGDEVWGDVDGLVPVEGDVVLRRGPLTYRIHQDVREEPVARALVEPEPTLWSSFSSLGALALGLVAVAAFAPEPPQVELVDLPERVTRVVLTPPAPEPEPEPTPEPVDTERGGDGAAAAGPPKDKVGTGGPSVEDAGLLAALDGGLLGDANLDLSLVAATGHLRAGSADGVPGGGGLGPRGGGLESGGSADGTDMRFRPGMEGMGDGLAPGGKRDGQLVQTDGDPLLIGALPASAIDEVIKRNLAQIRYCYQRRLVANPGLNGKITLSFTIAGDGSVSSARVARATLEDDAVHSCIVGRFLKMRFPEPQGGGVVSVTYPFLFSPG